MPLIGDLWADEDEAAEIWAAVAEADAEAETDEHVENFVAGQELQAAREELRVLEDADEDAMPRRGTSEARLARAIARLATDSYVPGPELRDRPAPGLVTGSSTCGPEIEGFCRNREHTALCGSISTTETAQALQATGMYAERAQRPWTDATGLPLTRHDGSPATLADVFEANSGQRLHGAADFEQGYARPPVVSVTRDDPLAGAGPDEGVLAAGRDAMNITAPPSAHERGAELLAQRIAAGWHG